ncbi:PAS domain-containing protein [bacterium]|nr:PAS domain-containing protein [bacterium]
MALRTQFFWKLYSVYAILIVLTALTVGLLIQFRISADSLLRIERSLQQQCLMLEAMAQDSLQAGAALPALDDQLKDLGRATATRFTVIRDDGVVLADSHMAAAEMENHANRPELLAAGSSGSGMSRRFSRSVHERMMYYAVAVHDGSRLTGYVRTSLPLSDIDNQLSALRLSVLMGTGITLLVSLPLGLLFARRVTRPVTRMMEVARGISRGNYSKRAEVMTHDELGQLAEMLNSMSDSLAQRMLTIARDRSQLEAILSSMSEGLIAVDSQERIVHVNRVAAGYCRQEYDAIAGRHAWECLTVPELVQALSAAISNGSTIQRELELVGTGSNRWISIIVTPWRDATEGVLGAVGIIRDITGTHEFEHMRTQFIANASHELKSPVTAIRGLAETIISDPEMEHAVRDRFMGSILDESLRLSGLVNDMLSLSRVEHGFHEREDEPLDLASTARLAIDNCSAKSESAGVEIRLSLPDQPIRVMGDQENLLLAIGNLVDNAIKYAGSRQLVEVRVGLEGSSPFISVRDYGLGIPEEHHARIFERFYRVDKARSRQLGGTGLGLAIVKHVMIAHGGEVRIKSSPGEGSEFILSFPSELRGN